MVRKLVITATVNVEFKEIFVPIADPIFLLTISFF